MTMPPFAKAVQKNDRELLRHMQELRDFVETDGALPARFKILMELFGDAILAHPDGVRSLSIRARSLGATEDEINETVRMAFLFGGLPGLVTATNAFPDAS